MNTSKTLDICTSQKKVVPLHVNYGIMVQFSIVIPLYNKAQSVLATLQCIAEQTYSQYEVIIVNDGSTDASEHVVRTWITNHGDNRWQVLAKTNGGVSSARNYGVRHASYEYIAFLDADDYWEPAYLQTQAQMIEDFPSAAMWSVGWGYLKGQHKIPVSHKPQNHRGYITNYWTMPKGTNIFFVCVSVCRRSALELLEGFDVRMKYGEDLDLAYRMILNYSVAFYNMILGYYRLDAENRACVKHDIRLEDRLQFYIDKYQKYRCINKEFCRYFDRGVVIVGARYLFDYNDKGVFGMLSQVDYSLQPFYYRIYFHTPLLIGKSVYRSINALKKLYSKYFYGSRKC